MKALVQIGYGSDEMLEFQDLKTPVPDDNEVLVKVCATAISYWECGILKPPFVLRLLLGFRRPRGKFRIMGCDMAGIVEFIGSQVKNFKPGDKVYGDLSGYRFGGVCLYYRATSCSNATGIKLRPSRGYSTRRRTGVTSDKSGD